MIEIQIINIPSLFWKHNTFLAVYCTLGIYLKTKNKKQKKNSKTNKQTKQNKKEKKEGKKKVLTEFEPGTFGLTRPHIATTPLRMIT